MAFATITENKARYLTDMLLHTCQVLVVSYSDVLRTGVEQPKQLNAHQVAEQLLLATSNHKQCGSSAAVDQATNWQAAQHTHPAAALKTDVLLMISPAVR